MPVPGKTLELKKNDCCLTALVTCGSWVNTSFHVGVTHVSPSFSIKFKMIISPLLLIFTGDPAQFVCLWPICLKSCSISINMSWQHINPCACCASSSALSPANALVSDANGLTCIDRSRP